MPGMPLRTTVTPAISATPLTRTTGEEASSSGSTRSRPWSKPPMIPMPSTMTLVCALTMMSMPPITALAVITTSGVVNTASRRSRSMPPISVNAVWVGPTSHTPLRSWPPMIARLESWRTAEPAAGDAAGRRTGVAPVGRSSWPVGRSTTIGTRSAYTLAA